VVLPGGRRCRSGATLVLLALPLCRVTAQQPPELPASVAFVSSGGHWEDGAHHGYYRLGVLHAAPGTTGPRLLIEWIEEDGSHLVVRESHGISVLGDPWVLTAPQITAGAHRTTATVSGSDPSSGRQAHWTISLGGPGRFGVSPVRSVQSK